MREQRWEAVKDHLGKHRLELGPQFAYQALYTPRHLSFVFARYKFAAKLIASKPRGRVLELGCGEGIGALLLAEGGHDVVGVDLDSDAIEYAKNALEKYEHLTVSFVHGDILDVKLGEFDSVVSLDAIEHIPKKEEEMYMQTVYDHVNDEGFCCIGTPNITAQQYASEASKKGHINLFDAERIRELVGKYFKHTFVFGMNDEVVHTGFYPMCHYLMVLACGKR